MKIFGENPTRVETDFEGYLRESDNTRRVYDFFLRELPKGNHDRDKFNREISRTGVKISKIIQGSSRKGMKRAIARGNEVLAEYYDRMGADHDHWVADRNWKNEVYFLGLMADNFEEGDGLIVDAGCGSGLDIVALASLFPNKHFFGYDSSRVQLDLARKRAGEHNLANIGFHQCCHTSIPLADNSVDLLLLKRYQDATGYINNEALRKKLFMRELERKNREFRRVLKDSGVLLRVSHEEGGRTRDENPGFGYFGSIVFPQSNPPSIDKPYDIAFFHKK